MSTYTVTLHSLLSINETHLFSDGFYMRVAVCSVLMCCVHVQVAVSSGEVGSTRGGKNEVPRTLGKPEAVFSSRKGSF